MVGVVFEMQQSTDRHVSLRRRKERRRAPSTDRKVNHRRRTERRKGTVDGKTETMSTDRLGPLAL